MGLRVLVVDDEAPARSRLVRLLAKIDAAIVVSQAQDGAEAIRSIGSEPPDVVLLDIRMPGLSGLEVARVVREQTAVVFTTAYDVHALEAFDVDAVDYLVKPVRREKLAAALQKARRRSLEGRGAWLEAVARVGSPDTARLAARVGDAWELFDVDELVRLYALDKYVAFRHGTREVLVDQSLTALSERLAPHGFFRIHRGELVALDKVVALRKEPGGWLVELTDGQTARVGRRLLAELKERLGIRPLS